MMPKKRETSTDDLEALLGLIYRQYHYDFRSYSRGTLVRSVERARNSMGIATTERLLERISEDPAAFTELLRHLTVQVSDFFRDADYFTALRERVIPHLATYPLPRIWVAGCGTGEEAYSIAILLEEEGLLDRSLIYATDIATEALERAAAGVYDIDRVSGFSENYVRSGGRAALSDYYTAMGATATFSRRLRDRIVFSEHSLATDAAFAEVQLVSCRNVLIYFNRELQDRAVGLFRDAVSPRGFLGLGASETLACTPHATAFERFAARERIYRLRAGRPT